MGNTSSALRFPLCHLSSPGPARALRIWPARYPTWGGVRGRGVVCQEWLVCFRGIKSTVPSSEMTTISDSGTIFW